MLSVATPLSGIRSPTRSPSWRPDSEMAISSARPAAGRRPSITTGLNRLPDGTATSEPAPGPKPGGPPTTTLTSVASWTRGFGGQHVADRVGDLARREDDDVGPSRPLRHPVDRGRGAARSRDPRRSRRPLSHRPGRPGRSGSARRAASWRPTTTTPRASRAPQRGHPVRRGGWAADAVTPHRVRLFPPPIAITQPPIRRTTAHKGRDDTGRPWSRRVAGVGRWARSRSHRAREARNSPWSGEFRA